MMPKRLTNRRPSGLDSNWSMWRRRVATSSGWAGTSRTSFWARCLRERSSSAVPAFVHAVRAAEVHDRDQGIRQRLIQNARSAHDRHRCAHRAPSGIHPGARARGREQSRVTVDEPLVHDRHGGAGVEDGACHAVDFVPHHVEVDVAAIVEVH